MSDPILVESLEPGVISVLLNRPERRNALSIELLERLCADVEKLADDHANRVVILRGAGPVFSSGLDLQEAADDLLIERSATAVQRALDLLRETPLIVVAAVQGGAFAGGAGLMAACDIVIAADEARFGFPEARRGLLPALICDVVMHRVREGDLRDLFLCGDPIDAQRARGIGLVQHVVPGDRLLDEALHVARAILAGGPETIRQTKALLGEMFRPVRDARQSPGAAEHTETHATGALATHLAARRSNEAREGLAAFAEKREPNWR